jgi:hypothetical protein
VVESVKQKEAPMADDGEGSVFVEGFDDDVEETSSEESQDSTVDTSTETTASEETKSEEVKQETTNINSQETVDEKAELTEKGTKLDPNPLSRVNQELANERAKIKQYEEVLNNPTLLKSYVAQIDKQPEKVEEKVPEKIMREEDVKTTEDLRVYLKQQDEKLNSKLKELDSTISTVKSSQRDTAVANGISNDIQAVREQYPELNPKSDSYDPELDTAVGAMYELIDLDPKTKQFRGNIRITDVASIIMKASGSSKKQGSQEAQTVIKDKRSGKVTSGSSSQVSDISNMTPSQIIASRIKQARGGR